MAQICDASKMRILPSAFHRLQPSIRFRKQADSPISRFLHFRTALRKHPVAPETGF